MTRSRVETKSINFVSKQRKQDFHLYFGHEKLQSYIWHFPLFPLLNFLFFLTACRLHYLVRVRQFYLESYYLHHLQYGLQSGIQENYVLCVLVEEMPSLMILFCCRGR